MLTGTNMQDNSQNRQLYLNFMKTSTQYLKSQGIVDQINQRNIQQWKILKPDERVKYFNFMQQSLLKPEKNQREIIEFMKPKNQLGVQKVEVNIMDLINDQIKSKISQNDIFPTKVEQFPIHKQSQLKQPMKQQNHVLIDVFEDLKNLNKEVKSPNEKKNQNKEYIKYYKEQYKIIQRQSPYIQPLEITKIVKEQWKQFKKLKKVYQDDENCSRVQKKVEREIPAIMEKNHPTSVAPIETKNNVKEIPFNEIIFHFLVKDQKVIKINGDMLVQALKEQNKQQIFIDLNKIPQNVDPPIKVDNNEEIQNKIKCELKQKADTQFEGDSFVMSISGGDEANNEYSLKQNQTASENALSIGWEDQSDNLLENLTISDSSEPSYPNLDRKIFTNPLINILKQNI